MDLLVMTPATELGLARSNYRVHVGEEIVARAPARSLKGIVLSGAVELQRKALDFAREDVSRLYGQLRTRRPQPGCPMPTELQLKCSYARREPYSKARFAEGSPPQCSS